MPRTPPIESPKTLQAALQRVLGVGLEHATDAHQRRKVFQVNVGAVFSLITLAIFLATFLAIGNPALIRSGLVQVPLVVGLYVVVRWCQRHGRLGLARHALFLGLSIDLLTALLAAQGTVIAIQDYFLMLAAAGIVIFPIQQWRAALLHAALNIGLFTFFQIHGWAGDPRMADLAPLTVTLLQTFIIVSCVVLTLLLMLVSELSAWRNERELQNLADTDALTQLPNRRAFRTRLEQDLRALRSGRDNLCVAVIDIDFFKAVNDAHGHDAGDAMLQAIAQRLMSQLRSSDMLARIGGEEFALLMPKTTLAHAVQVAERMRGAIDGQAFELGGAQLLATISVGLAAVGDTQPFDGALKSADAALYRAKAEGRNRVVVAPGEVPA